MSEASRPKPPKQSAVSGRRRQGEPDETNAGRPVDPADVSRYIAEICGELSGMASAAELKMLTYLLGMARQEADRIAKSAQGRTEPS